MSYPKEIRLSLRIMNTFGATCVIAILISVYIGWNQLQSKSKVKDALNEEYDYVIGNVQSRSIGKHVQSIVRMKTISGSRGPKRTTSIPYNKEYRKLKICSLASLGT